MLSLTGNAELKIYVPKNISVGEVITGSCVTSKNDFKHVPEHAVQISLDTTSDNNGCTLNVSDEVQTEGKHYEKAFTITCNTSGSHHIECLTNGKYHNHKSMNFQGI